MKKLVGLLLGSVIATAIVMGVLSMISWFIDWACADQGRYILAMIIIGYVVAKMIKKELEL
ncbi:MAG: hypothetical protein IJE43_14500 [Alphaproteobacteria bacterium]|nr:hypothetical protein [Alphaproteobacteria bacterium]MBQ6992869.1 hypothetical protein [Clostridia bacterium]MBR2849336.1 hypothetical protein [Mycoplasmataceae bacterium]